MALNLKISITSVGGWLAERVTVETTLQVKKSRTMRVCDGGLEWSKHAKGGGGNDGWSAANAAVGCATLWPLSLLSRHCTALWCGRGGESCVPFMRAACIAIAIAMHGDDGCCLLGGYAGC
jgi:hypothetical protein